MILPARMLYGVASRENVENQHDQHFDVYFDKMWYKK